MYCRSCNTQLADGAIACTNCGKAPLNGEAFCQNCGNATVAGAVACPSCGHSLTQGIVPGVGPITAQSRVVIAICAIFLGSLGIHKFLLGYNHEGIIMLVVTLVGGAAAPFTCGLTALAPAAMSIAGLIEGITYLTKTDDQFNAMYIANKKAWF